MATLDQVQPESTSSPKTRRRLLPKPEVIRDNITGWLFISPAALLIFIFGLFPIGYALYMSLHRWRIRRGNFLCDAEYAGTVENFADRVNLDYVRACFSNYERFIGDWGGLVITIAGFAILLGAYFFWTEAFKARRQSMLILRVGLALAIIAFAFAVIGHGWNTMTGATSTRDQGFLDGLQITFYYAFGSVPFQLMAALVLAYVLFQNIAGKETYRMLFFLPYVTPAVAAAVVFGVVFSGRSTSLMNQILEAFGGDPQRWASESRPFLNVVFGWDLDGFLAGPSMALVTVIFLGWWTYTGYNAVIFLAGLGNIPGDLYEAARVDGASDWHMFRYITLPLLSPITFYLSVLAFIGTFKAFNTLYVIRTPAAQGTLDTAGLVIFDTFQQNQRYGEATAQAIMLFIVILTITQLQRQLFEKRVFYG